MNSCWRAAGAITAPLSHMAAALLGVGETRIDGRIVSASESLLHAGLSPLTLAPKEGVASINGTQVSMDLALSGLFLGEDVLRAALVTGPSRSRAHLEASRRSAPETKPSAGTVRRTT